MNNPNQGAQEAPKTSPQSDNKPTPQQQQQGGDKQDGSKPDQQQQK